MAKKTKHVEYYITTIKNSSGKTIKFYNCNYTKSVQAYYIVCKSDVLKVRLDQVDSIVEAENSFEKDGIIYVGKLAEEIKCTEAYYG